MKVYSPHHWPAEWEMQETTWIAWPHNTETWPGHFEKIPPVFERLVHELTQMQRVDVLAGPQCDHCRSLESLRSLRGVTIHDVPTNDAWIRDFGPTFVHRSEDQALVGIDWRYNAWGGKYLPCDDDAAATEWICRLLRCTRSQSAMHCEGGALEGNGQGIVMTTRSCLLNPNRNPGWPQIMLENELRAQLGVNQIIWVNGGGMQGDDTDGHIDQLARFVSHDTIVVATSSHADDPNRVGLEENLRQLRNARTLEGEAFVVHALPTPPPRFISGQRVPESYCNFVLGNGMVIVPTFRSAYTDQQALETFARLLPDRRIIPLDAFDLAWGLGALHCATQHQPRAGKPK